ncbi:YfhO family protein [Sunxiuqinia elliptica]|uniref:Membrane protein YfhO n=1 Tax=Sunxiuqinia elliptica TaxID=655355 RepID=A0A4R6H7B8_9BACT|nr:YfhO family protein [Sunxiuqinia elliptica]TDO03894.1 membrane protein YfhO [Sunxiuqinia elliptica]TDO62176.1 membrane protein YfhO [Sunxiuqinia elliptica]
MTKIKGNRNIWIGFGIILFFILISFIYFSPQLEGKQLDTHDISMYKGGAKELNDFRDETGEEALWTNSMFGGMPGYLLSTKYPGNLVAKVQAFTNVIPRPARYLILMLSLFFAMLWVLRVNPWVSAVGALSYGMFTFFFVIIGAGHMSKAHTLTYMALVVGGVLLAYKRNRWLGSLLASIGLALMLTAGHPQMTYYAGIMVAILGIAYLVDAVREKTIPAFLKTSSLLVVAALLAVGTNFGNLYTVYEYGKYSIRGESELTPDEDQTSGLDKSYILDYSYDLGEAMTAFIPRFKGGGMAEPLGEESHVYQFFEANQGKAQAKRISESLPLYWGSQPISSAPFYYGAVLCFLFVLGLFVVKGKDKWWLAGVVVAAFLLSLGKNFPALSHFMIDYFPGYNKFRDVKNIIVIQQFAMAFLGVLAVRELYLKSLTSKELEKRLKYAWIVVGGLALVFALLPGLAGNFTAPSDARLMQAGWPEQLMDALRADRKMVLRTDAFKAFLFVTLAAGVIWLYLRQKIKATYALLAWAVLILVDVWPVNKRYLNNDDFVSSRKVETPFVASTADQEILKDTDPDYRVLNMAVNPFADAATSYFHKSIGGYHGAKMQRYQEVIEHHISPEMQQLGTRLQSVKTQADVEQVFEGLGAINMLNTRYVIYNPEAGPLYNEHALGNAWFVEEIDFVGSADEEIAALGEIDPSATAVVDERFSEALTAVSFNSGEQPVIKLEEYQPNYLKYEANVSSGTPLAVFSEIYYPKGWNAYIDGKLAEHVRVDYILRGLPIPSGKHTVEFKFEPKSYAIGNKVSLASSLILILSALALVFFEFKKKAKHEEETSGEA